MPQGYNLYSLETNLEEVQDRFQVGAMRAGGMFMSKFYVGRPVARIVEDSIRAEAPRGCTGNLKAGIRARVTSRYGDTVSIEATSEAYYTRWVIHGRGPVRPVRAKVLHWKTCSGEDVFAMYAGPVEPNPFHERGWRNAAGQVAQRWRGFGQQIADALTG
jgi:hypothetical protein